MPALCWLCLEANSRAQDREPFRLEDLRVRVEDSREGEPFRGRVRFSPLVRTPGGAYVAPYPPLAPGAGPFLVGFYLSTFSWHPIEEGTALEVRLPASMPLLATLEELTEDGTSLCLRRLLPLGTDTAGGECVLEVPIPRLAPLPEELRLRSALDGSPISGAYVWIVGRPIQLGLGGASGGKSPLTGEWVRSEREPPEPEPTWWSRGVRIGQRDRGPAVGSLERRRSRRDGRVAPPAEGSFDEGDHLLVHAEGFGWTYVVPRGTSPGQGVMEIELLPAATLDVVLGGRPPDDEREIGVLVSCYQRDCGHFIAEPRERLEWLRLGGSSGQVRVRNLPAGVPLEVRLVVDGTVSRRVWPVAGIESGGKRELTVTVPATPPVEVVLLRSNGTPVRWEEILIYDLGEPPGPVAVGPFEPRKWREREVKTDEEGRLRVGGLSAGTYLLVAGLPPVYRRERWRTAGGRYWTLRLGETSPPLELEQDDPEPVGPEEPVRRAWILGMLMDAATGYQRPGLVELVDSGGTVIQFERVFSRSYDVDWAGRFHISAPRGGELQLRARSVVGLEGSVRLDLSPGAEPPPFFILPVE